jgi:hypothetical protein
LSSAKGRPKRSRKRRWRRAASTEEKLFMRRRDLVTDLSAVFMDTTSLSF